MPSGASKRAPQPRQDQSVASPPPHAGQASSSENASGSIRSEDRVDERRQGLDGGGENQHEPEQAEKHRQRNQPALAGVAAPEAARQLRGRSCRAADHDHPPAESSTLLEHQAYSLIDGIDTATRLVTMPVPATSTSMPQRRNVR